MGNIEREACLRCFRSEADWSADPDCPGLKDGMCEEPMGPVEYVPASQLRGAVSLTDAELIEVEWSLRQRLDAWDDPDDRKARAATERAHRKILARIGGQ